MTTNNIDTLTTQAIWGYDALRDFFLVDGGFDRTKGTNEQKKRVHHHLLRLAEKAGTEDPWIDRQDSLALWGFVCLEFEITPPEILIRAISSSGGIHPKWIGQLSFDLTNYLFEVHTANSDHSDSQCDYLIPLSTIEITRWRLFAAMASRCTTPDLYDSGLSGTIDLNIELNDLAFAFNAWTQDQLGDFRGICSLLKGIASLGGGEYVSEAAYILARMGDDTENWLEIASNDGYLLARYSYGCEKLRSKDDIFIAMSAFKKITFEGADEYLNWGESLISMFPESQLILAEQYEDLRIKDLLCFIVEKATNFLGSRRSARIEKPDRSRSDQKQSRTAIDFLEIADESSDELSAKSWCASALNVKSQLLVVLRFRKLLSLVPPNQKNDYISAVVINLGKLLEAVLKHISIKCGGPLHNYKQLNISVDWNLRLEKHAPKQQWGAVEKFFDSFYLKYLGAGLEKNSFIDASKFDRYKVKQKNWEDAGVLIYHLQSLASNPKSKSKSFIWNGYFRLEPLVAVVLLSSFEDTSHPLRSPTHGATFDDLFDWYTKRNIFAHFKDPSRTILTEKDAILLSNEVEAWVDRIMTICS